MQNWFGSMRMTLVLYSKFASHILRTTFIHPPSFYHISHVHTDSTITRSSMCVMLVCVERVIFLFTSLFFFLFVALLARWTIAVDQLQQQKHMIVKWELIIWIVTVRLWYRGVRAYAHSSDKNRTICTRAEFFRKLSGNLWPSLKNNNILSMIMCEFN